MKVQATQTGFYDLQRRREGAVFEITKPEEYSPNWMRPMEPWPKDWEEAINQKAARNVSFRKRLDELRGKLPESKRDERPVRTSTKDAK